MHLLLYLLWNNKIQIKVIMPFLKDLVRFSVYVFFKLPMLQRVSLKVQGKLLIKEENIVW